jgi:hypothetical protein
MEFWIVLLVYVIGVWLREGKFAGSAPADTVEWLAFSLDNSY